jgi:hypothetical protein
MVMVQEGGTDRGGRYVRYEKLKDKITTNLEMYFLCLSSLPEIHCRISGRLQ